MLRKQKVLDKEMCLFFNGFVILDHLTSDIPTKLWTTHLTVSHLIHIRSLSCHIRVLCANPKLSVQLLTALKFFLFCVCEYTLSATFSFHLLRLISFVSCQMEIGLIKLKFRRIQMCEGDVLGFCWTLNIFLFYSFFFFYMECICDRQSKAVDGMVLLSPKPITVTLTNHGVSVSSYIQKRVDDVGEQVQLFCEII